MDWSDGHSYGTNIMTHKVLGYDDGHLLVEYTNGQRFNVRVDHIIAEADPDRPPPQFQNRAASQVEGHPTAKIAGTRYTFNKGDVLPEHEHDASTLHDIKVVSGRVKVMREKSGDTTAKAGDLVVIQVGEKHSVIALEDSVTVHTLLN
jgi:quercetin dioxygenase-like cupin family protein